ncbi:MAG: hypothetical protein FGM22_08375 [Burkholderiaceae bacterium]|nr:hypothetical protein [Burkholderiaceae bacterium]
MEAFSFISGLLIFIVVAVIFVLAILMPVYVFQIHNLAKKIEEHTRTSAAYTATLHTEQQRANVLTRQMLRAYGHEPEA